MRIFASVTFVALLSTSTVHALADQFEWGPLTSQPRNDQNTIWDANCNDSSEHVVLDNALLPRGAGPDHQAATVKVFATKCKKVS